jgi:hypothetical protein
MDIRYTMLAIILMQGTTNRAFFICEQSTREKDRLSPMTRDKSPGTLEGWCAGAAAGGIEMLQKRKS